MREWIDHDVDCKPWNFNLGIDLGTGTGRSLTDAADHWTVKALFALPLP